MLNLLLTEFLSLSLFSYSIFLWLLLFLNLLTIISISFFITLNNFLNSMSTTKFFFSSFPFDISSSPWLLILLIIIINDTSLIVLFKIVVNYLIGSLIKLPQSVFQEFLGLGFESLYLWGVEGLSILECLFSLGIVSSWQPEHTWLWSTKEMILIREWGMLTLSRWSLSSSSSIQVTYNHEH